MTPPKSPPQPAVSVEQARVFRIALWNTLRGRGMADQVCYDIINPTMDALPASAAPPADGVPAGFVLVPIEPTSAMYAACKTATWIGPGYAQAAWEAMLSAAPKATTAPIGEAGEERFVVGPVWRETEEEDECWTSEVQAIGGHAVVATVHAGSETEVIARRDAILAALSPSTGAEREADRAAAIDAMCQARCLTPNIRWDDAMTEGMARIERMLCERQYDAIAALGEQGGK